MFTVRVRAQEKKRFETLAAAAGLTLTQWVRRTLLAVADRQEGTAPGEADDKRRRPT